MKLMSDINKRLDARDLKSVAINSLQGGKPGPDDPCQPFWNWCTVMEPKALEHLRKINPADLAVLVRLEIIKESVLTKDQINAIKVINDALRPRDDDPCPSNMCIKMNAGALDYLHRINPADLNALVEHGIVSESILSNNQKTALKDIRITK